MDDIFCLLYLHSEDGLRLECLRFALRLKPVVFDVCDLELLLWVFSADESKLRVFDIVEFDTKGDVGDVLSCFTSEKCRYKALKRFHKNSKVPFSQCVLNSFSKMKLRKKVIELLASDEEKPKLLQTYNLQTLQTFNKDEDEEAIVIDVSSSGVSINGVKVTEKGKKGVSIKKAKTVFIN